MTTEIKDLRTAERYVVTEALGGSFGSVSIVILNVSDSGVQIEHANPLRLATKARLWFRRGDVTVSGQALVMWSHLSRQPNNKGKLLYHSGLRIEEGVEDLQKAIEVLSLIGVLRRDVDSLKKKSDRIQQRDQAKSGQPVVRVLHQQSDVPADQVLLVQHARARLRADPAESAKWYERARASMEASGGEARGEMIGYHHDMLAVWEYLERSIELPVILKVFEKPE